MGRSCTICSHKDVAKINDQLVSGESYRDIALQFDVGHMSLKRHTAHIASALVEASTEVKSIRTDNLVEQIGALQASANACLRRAEEAGDLRIALAAIREARENIALLARVALVAAQLKAEADRRQVKDITIVLDWGDPEEEGST